MHCTARISACQDCALIQGHKKNYINRWQLYFLPMVATWTCWFSVSQLQPCSSLFLFKEKSQEALVHPKVTACFKWQGSQAYTSVIKRKSFTLRKENLYVFPLNFIFNFSRHRKAEHKTILFSSIVTGLNLSFHCTEKQQNQTHQHSCPEGKPASSHCGTSKQDFT